jgi:pimeloyl-ACP methyl ester carboxylesterase
MPFAKIDGRQLHYTAYTPPDTNSQTLTIVFVHGLGSTQNFYGPIIPYLSQYRCVTFDNYAAGRSKYYSELSPETSIERIGQDVLGLMDHLSVEKAIVVGYSMGGMVPTTVAADKKGKPRVVAGILLGPVHPNEGIGKVMEGRVATVSEGMYLPPIEEHNMGYELTLFLLRRRHRDHGKHSPPERNRSTYHSTPKIIHPRNDHVSGSGWLHR